MKKIIKKCDENFMIMAISKAEFRKSNHKGVPLSCFGTISINTFKVVQLI